MLTRLPPFASSFKSGAESHGHFSGTFSGLPLNGTLICWLLRVLPRWLIWLHAAVRSGTCKWALDVVWLRAESGTLFWWHFKRVRSSVKMCLLIHASDLLPRSNCSYFRRHVDERRAWKKTKKDKMLERRSLLWRKFGGGFSWKQSVKTIIYSSHSCLFLQRLFVCLKDFLKSRWFFSLGFPFSCSLAGTSDLLGVVILINGSDVFTAFSLQPKWRLYEINIVESDWNI